MNLNYSILWFDDAAEYFDSLDLGPLVEKIEGWGFTPDLKIVTSPEEFMAESPFSRFDLIVVDYNLQEYHEHGDVFIEKIRAQDIFTEVIFYSANPSSDLWDAIREKTLEGVFVANREAVLQKIENVARQSVKKVLDLENMRGIVMSEVGDIDQLLESILRYGFSTLNGDAQVAVFEGFHKEALKQANSQAEALEKFIGEPDIEVMLELCDSNKKWENFNRLKKHHIGLKKIKIGEYHREVLVPRNFLAHGLPEAEGAGYKFSHRGKSYSFDEKVGVDLRKTILSYKKLFTGIETELRAK